MEKKRNSTIELLRIITMAMIVLCHFATYGKFNFFDFSGSVFTVSRLWWCFISLGGNLGVIVFVLISGYYLIENSGLSFRKVSKLWGQVFFYSCIVGVIVFVTNDYKIGLKSIARTILPITFEQWWFASAYMILFIIHPIINHLLLILSKKDYQKLLAVLIVIWQIIPTFTAQMNQSNPLIQFVMWYAIGGYIKLYGLNPKLKSKHYLVLYAILELIIFSSALAFLFLEYKWSLFGRYTAFFYSKRSILTLLSAICLFMTFATAQRTYSVVINKLASATFGVYLLHESEVMRILLWEKVFNDVNWIQTWRVIFYSLLVLVAVYSIGTIVDLIRQAIFEKAWVNTSSVLYEKSLEKIKKQRIVEYIKENVFGEEN
jgi:surface polysaccharide O-acyltransferase-like enzyme